jgi:hypothetical protein
VKSYADTVEYLRNIMARYILGLDKVLPILEELRKEVSLVKTRDVKMHKN